MAQPVTVDILVQDDTGAPIEGLVVSLFSESDVWDENVTDAQGQVELTVARPATHPTLIVGLSAASVERQGVTKWRDWEERRMEILGTYSTPGVFEIPLEADVSEYSLTIDMNAAISISGRVFANGEPAPSGVGAIGALWGATADFDTGHFVVGGIELGTTAALSFTKTNGQMKLLWFDENETLADVEIGDVILNLVEGDSRLDLDLGGWDQLDLRARVRMPNVTLVRDDGNLAIWLAIDEQGRARVLQSPNDDLVIPAGTYYISTGTIGPDPVANRLARLVHDGVVDLDTAGVPKVTVAPGNVTTISLDAATVEAAVMNAGP